MILEKLKKLFLAILLTFTIIPSVAFAYSDYIVASGENIGIELKFDGIVVVGFYKINDISPAEEVGLKIGDIIISINDKKVSSIDDMINIMNALPNKESILIKYLRNNKEYFASLKLEKDENDIYKTGLYVKDSVAGIGTLTFIDPESKLFGALGHEILEKNTNQIIDIKTGTIFSSKVTGIIPSDDGNPGEKQAIFYNKEVKGNVFENTNKGVFGIFNEKFNTNKLYKVAGINEIKVGKAKILTVIKNDEVKEYEINILKLNNRSKTKNIVFEITDEELLSKTGGIVQGMSGSPIIQGDYIIGAVTHVVIENPTNGYGIFITNMLEEAEN